MNGALPIPWRWNESEPHGPLPAPPKHSHTHTLVIDIILTCMGLGIISKQLVLYVQDQSWDLWEFGSRAWQQWATKFLLGANGSWEGWGRKHSCYCVDAGDPRLHLFCIPAHMDTQNIRAVTAAKSGAEQNPLRDTQAQRKIYLIQNTY